MTTIREFAEGPWRREHGSKPEMDPFTEDDALMEAQILDVHLNTLQSRAAILFELRLALQLREGNTGLLVAEGVTRFEWHASQRNTARTAWTVVGSAPRSADGTLEMRLGVLPQAGLLLRARSVAFYSGDVEDLLEIPDYGTASASELASMTAQWDSKFVPLHAVFVDPNPFAGQE